MNDATDPNPDRDRDRDRRPHARRSPDDLDLLRSHPCLTGFSGQGRVLDRLPVTSTTWAFLVATASSLLTLGFLGAVVVTIGSAIGFSLVALALLNRDVAAARAVLRATTIGLVGWLLLIALVIHPSTI